MPLNAGNTYGPDTLLPMQKKKNPEQKLKTIS